MMLDYLGGPAIIIMVHIRDMQESSGSEQKVI